MGKGRDRGAREPIKLITPTSAFPVEGKELGCCRQLAFHKWATSGASNPIFEGRREVREV